MASDSAPPTKTFQLVWLRLDVEEEEYYISQFAKCQESFIMEVDKRFPALVSMLQQIRQVLAPRIGYLPLLVPQIKPFFNTALPPGEDTVWFEYKGLPLNWFVVIDEAHAYKGAFGCHTALILRRLRRLCSHVYGSDPSFVFCTAISGNPREHAMELANLPTMELIQDDGSPSGRKLFVL